MKKNMPLNLKLANSLCATSRKSKLPFSFLVLVLCTLILLPQEAIAQKKKKKQIKFSISLSTGKGTVAGSYDNNAQATTVRTQVQHGKINLETGFSIQGQDAPIYPAQAEDETMQNYPEEEYEQSMEAPATETDHYQYDQAPAQSHAKLRRTNNYRRSPSTSTYRRPTTTRTSNSRVQRSNYRSRSVSPRTRTNTARSRNRYRPRGRQ